MINDCSRRKYVCCNFICLQLAHNHVIMHSIAKGGGDVERKRIAPDLNEIPKQLHPYFADATVYDSSCSATARVLFLDKEDGFYVANVAVEEKWRGRGIATALTAEMIQGRDLCTLECVIANEGAWRIYERLGFKIVYEYPGVHGIPCYKMIYKREG